MIETHHIKGEGEQMTKATGKFNFKMGDVVALIPSESGNKVYEVKKFEKGAWGCTCPAYRFTRGEIGSKFPCKHMRELFHDFRKGAISPRVTVLRADLL
jgi:predicted nucleic acid-binding Zn finger protein